jgi:hypothetical protein
MVPPLHSVWTRFTFETYARLLAQSCFSKRLLLLPVLTVVPQYVDPDGKRDLIKALGKLLVEGLGEENKTCLLLKAANQSVVAPGMLHPLL